MSDAASDPKQKTVHATAQERPEVQPPRQAYRHTTAPLPASELSLIDAAGVHMAMARPSTRALQGPRAHATTPCHQGNTITRLGALALAGVTAPMTREGRTETDIFVTSGQDLWCPCLRPGQVVMLDHLNPHKADEGRQAIEAVGAKIDDLPPDSPDFSPIDACWSKVTTLIRAQAASTYAALDSVILQAFKAITWHDVQGWVSHGGYVAQ